MFLIDLPFVSDFLIKTIRENNYKVVATKEARGLILDESLNWISEKDAVRLINDNPNIPIYSNSENVIAWIANNIGSSKLSKQIELFKNKASFRSLIKDSFPDFFFKTVALEEIQTLKIEDIPFPFVIKPTYGFFSLGVHIVRNISDWNIVKKELNRKNLKSIYPKEVLNVSTFIIEEYIQGEEYAVDCYFNNVGEAVVLNILHHKFSTGTDVSDRVYSTSKELILKYKNDVEAFLNSIGKKAGLKNFPMHVELRIDNNGKICPIEVNPLRFGGWCTTADLSWHAYAINSYKYFMNNLKPNWKQIFKNNTHKKFSVIVLNNNSDFTNSQISNFDYNLLAEDFENPVEIRALDIKKYPVFGFVFAETSLDNEVELDTILTSNLNKYITV